MTIQLVYIIVPADAINKANSIAITGTVNAGVRKLVDPRIRHNACRILSFNEALPRKSIVRRAGDTMTGPLYAHDHPTIGRHYWCRCR